MCSISLVCVCGFLLFSKLGFLQITNECENSLRVYTCVFMSYSSVTSICINFNFILLLSTTHSPTLQNYFIWLHLKIDLIKLNQLNEDKNCGPSPKHTQNKRICWNNKWEINRESEKKKDIHRHIHTPDVNSMIKKMSTIKCDKRLENSQENYNRQHIHHDRQTVGRTNGLKGWTYCAMDICCSVCGFEYLTSSI